MRELRLSSGCVLVFMSLLATVGLWRLAHGKHSFVLRHSCCQLQIGPIAKIFVLFFGGQHKKVRFKHKNVLTKLPQSDSQISLEGDAYGSIEMV